MMPLPTVLATLRWNTKTAVGVGLEPVDLLAQLEDRRRALDVGEQRHRRLHAVAAELADLGELLRLGRDAAQVVERDRVGDILDQVQDVVHVGDQLVDLVAIEGRDEGLVQERDALVRDLVRGALRRVDPLRVRVELVEGADHRRELAAALDDALGVGIEQVEELALAGHQASEHSYSFIPRPRDSSRFTSPASKPQSASAPRPPWPRSGGGWGTAVPVREKRGAGAGCSTFATVVNAARAV